MLESNAHNKINRGKELEARTGDCHQTFLGRSRDKTVQFNACCANYVNVTNVAGFGVVLNLWECPQS